MTVHLVGAGYATLPAWPWHYLQPVGYLHQPAQLLPASWIYTESAWTAVAGQGSCMMHAAVWRNSSLSARLSLRLLPQPGPLLTSTDVRPVQGGEPATKGGGRRGLRGGKTTLSPVLTPRQQKTTIPIPSPVPVSPSPLLPPPHQHKRSHPSRHLCHRSGRRHRSCHRSRHPRRGKGSRCLATLRAPAVVLLFWPKKGKFRKSTDVVHRLRLRCRHRHPRRASLLPSSRTSHPCSRRYHLHS